MLQCSTQGIGSAFPFTGDENKFAKSWAKNEYHAWNFTLLFQEMSIQNLLFYGNINLLGEYNCYVHLRLEYKEFLVMRSSPLDVQKNA